jgi:hypothetical protein
MKRVIREHPTIYRLARPWLGRRFMDPTAGILHVPTTQVVAVARGRA